MAEISFFWAGTVTGDKGPYSDDQYSDIQRKLFTSDRAMQGILRFANQLAVTGGTSPIAVNTGAAIVDGKFYENDASLNVVIPTPVGATRIDRIVLRKDFAGQTVRITRIAGSEGGGAPALVQTDGTTWDIPLAQVSITTGGVITVTDERVFISVPISAIASQVFLSAGAAVIKITGGCAPAAQSEMATNKQNVKTLNFDATTEEHADFTFALPSDYNGGAITAKFIWMHPATTTNFGVVWGIEGRCYADDDALDQAVGTAQTVTDTGGTTSDVYISPETSAIAWGGAPAANKLLHLTVFRKAADGADTMAVDAMLVGVQLSYIRS
jgi:hypothetical protein